MAIEEQPLTGVDGAGNGSLDAWLAQTSADLERGVMSPRAFNDREIYDREMAQIFTKCWVYVGHVTEIPQPGDYVLRYIGQDQFILARDENGDIQCMLNNCSHRGTRVCRADQGNASHFRCPYHGWIYKNTGEWNGAPRRAKAYRKPDPVAFGLRKAPHVDSYHGLIFACLDENAVSLQEYLGDMCWYLDILFDVNAEGMSVVGDPQRWQIPADWKSGAENFVGDAYHVPHLHRSAQEVGAFPAIELAIDMQFQVALEGGHGMVGNRGNLPEPFGVMMDYPQQIVDLFDLSRLNERQQAFLKDRMGVTVFTIFPNLSFIRAPGTVDPNGMPSTITTLRQWQPKGPGVLEAWNWSLIWNAAPPEYSQQTYDTGVLGFSASGIFEQDDTFAWSGVPFAGRSQFARDNMKLNYQLGLDDMSENDLVPDWYGPGRASTTAFAEMNQRNWWQRWCEQMRSA